MARTPATKKNTVPAVPDSMGLLAGAAGAGMSTDFNDYAMPFLRVMQQMSPQLDKGSPLYIADAEVGDIANIVSKEVWSGDDGIYFIAVHNHTAYNEWSLQDDGKRRGNFVFEHPASIMTKTQRTAAGDQLSNGNVIIRTGTTYGLVVDLETRAVDRVVITAAVTQYKYWKTWQSAMANINLPGGDGRNVQAPAFAALWKISTQRTENDKGKWYSWVFDLADPIEGICGAVPGTKCEAILHDDQLVMAAMDFLEVIEAGEVKADYAREAGDEDIPFGDPAPTAGGAEPTAAPIDDEIPI